MAAIAAFYGVKLLTGKSDEPSRDISLFALSVFSGALLLKIVFITRIYGYGFVLAMPATLMVIYVLMSGIPDGLRRRGWVSGAIFRHSVLAVVCVLVSVYAVKSYKHYSIMDYPVGEGGDTIIASGHYGGKGVDILLEQIDKVMAPDEDFIIMPEGVLVNYLSRRKNPTEFMTFLPTDMTIYGEDRLLSALQASKPDYIILISRDTIEYGVHYLGQGYGDSIYSFVRSGYSDVVRIGDMSFLENSEGKGLGILILKRIGG
jgi:hypothetical protein